MKESKYDVGYRVKVTLKQDAEISKIDYKTDGLPIRTPMSLIIAPGEYTGSVQEVNKTDYGFYYTVRVEIITGLFFEISVHEMNLDIA